MKTKREILITGAKRYAGRVLLERLESEGHHINCLVRDPGKLNVTVASTPIFKALSDRQQASSIQHKIRLRKTHRCRVHSSVIRPITETTRSIAKKNAPPLKGFRRHCEHPMLQPRRRAEGVELKKENSK